MRTELEARIARLSPEQRRLLELRLQEERAATAVSGSIPRRDTNGPCRLSYAQERLWFIDQLEAASAAYYMAWAFRLRGPLDPSALQKAFETVVARHEVLRTVFHDVDGTPMQIVEAGRPVKLAVLDWTGDPSDERIRSVLAEEARRPFDLSRDLMIRGTLVHMRTGDHVLLITLDHIAGDGWSKGVLFRELGALYETFARGGAPSLPPLPIQYSDYAEWQRRWLETGPLEPQLAYWRSQLAGIPATLELATDHPRPASQSYRGARETLAVPEDVVEALHALAREERVTLFMILLAAFQVLLHRYTGETDIVVGTPIAGRNRAETEGLIGFFANMLALRADLSGEPAFREVLGRARETALDAYDHQDMPFEKLVEVLRPPRVANSTPIFQVVLTLQNTPPDALVLPGLEVEPLDVDTGATPFDFILNVMEKPDGLALQLRYCTDLFDAATARRMLGHYRTLLAAAVENPDRSIRELPILTEREQREVLVDWNNTRREYPRACIHELFEAQAERAPGRVAVVSGDDQLTYRELNRRANRLAHQLRGLGVGPEVPVGLCADRSLHAIVAMLGILKAGGAYVPLDPAYPLERLSFMARDSGVTVFVTERSSQNRWRERAAGIVVLEDLPPAGSEENPPSGAQPDGLAYIMYTSGSTGTPKGVEILHRGIVRLVCGTDFARLTEDSVILQAATLSFDASTFEIWGPLLHGGRCVLFPAAVPTARELGLVLRKHKVNTLWLTASLFNAVIDEAPEVLAPIRQLLVGGEALSASHVRRALELLPDVELINGYGPTESTTFACCHRIPKTMDGRAASIPIGKPIANTLVYIVDRCLQLAPPGAPGELCIGGDGLARGYRNRPGLTSGRFVPNPWSREPGARLYKTGDLARYRADGVIEYLGRLDEQVKIRGFRVEPGEVEAVLTLHPSVRAAAVIARDDRASAKRLIAYVVPHPERGIQSEQLREFVASKLPEYMVPSAFVVLERLPLTSSGKVDTRALPEPKWPSLAAADSDARRSVTELRLMKIWERLLGVGSIAVDRNFFDLGGHSLLAVKLLARIEKEFGVKLSLPALFQAPTIESLALLVGEGSRTSREPEITPIQLRGSRPPFFCIDGYSLFRPLAEALGPDQPFLGLPFPEPKDLPVPFRIEDIATHHVRTVREVQPEGPYYLGGWCLGGVIAYEVARQLAAQGQTIGLLALIDSVNPAAYALLSVLERAGARCRRLAGKLKYHVTNLRRLDAAGQWAYCAERARTILSRLRHEIWRAFYRLHLATARPLPELWLNPDQIRLAAAKSYRPQPFSGPISLFVPRVRPDVNAPDGQWGWTELALGGLEVIRVSGTHADMLEERNVAVLAEELGRRLGPKAG